jgi:hypothetical protein
LFFFIIIIIDAQQVTFGEDVSRYQ